MYSRILVATDGRPGSLGALRTARLLARREGTRVEVVAVFEPTDLYAEGPSHAVASLPPYYTPAAIDALRARVSAQLEQVGGGAAEWPLTLAVGPVAQTITRAAADQEAELVLLGLREPRGVERWLACETLLRMIHLSRVPVLAVPTGAFELPRRIVVAVDFSEFSRRAAGRAVALAAPDARLHLAHVTWVPVWKEGRGEPADSTEWERTYRAGVERRLEVFAARLERPEGIELETHLLAGEAGPELLRLAEEVDADLIAAGSHGAGFFGRTVLGSVSGKLVHGARCSLLISPPRSAPSELGLEELSERELLEDLGAAGGLALPDDSPSA